eukprot:7697410-Pyramimonas_sp.AAC.1
MIGRVLFRIQDRETCRIAPRTVSDHRPRSGGTPTRLLGCVCRWPLLGWPRRLASVGQRADQARASRRLRSEI